MDDKDSLAGLGRWVTQLRKNRGMNMKELAAALHVTPAVVSRVETGETVSEEIADDLDDFFDADGEIIAWRRRAVTRGRRRKKEVSPTNRRDLLYSVGTPVAVEALDRAERASRAITAGMPDQWTLAELAEDSTAIAAGRWSTPPEELLPEVLGRWRQLADMLERGPIGTASVQVVNLAGHYAYYAAVIGRHTDDRRLASGFGTLAEQYAEASGDPLLVGSVACMRSRVAFDGARFTEAAAIAGRAAGQAHPYTRARLFAYQAHALAAAGHPDQARDALANMRAHVVDLPRMPGAGHFGDGDKLLWPAMTLVEIGDHRDAETFAREALAGAPPNLYEHRGLAWLTIGQALAGRDPGAAADAGVQALASTRSWPSAYIDRHVRRLHRDLSRHGKVAEVAQLGAECEAARGTL